MSIYVYVYICVYIYKYIRSHFGSRSLGEQRREWGHPLRQRQACRPWTVLVQSRTPARSYADPAPRHGVAVAVNNATGRRGYLASLVEARPHNVLYAKHGKPTASPNIGTEEMSPPTSGPMPSPSAPRCPTSGTSSWARHTAPPSCRSPRLCRPKGRSKGPPPFLPGP